MNSSPAPRRSPFRPVPCAALVRTPVSFVENDGSSPAMVPPQRAVLLFIAEHHTPKGHSEKEMLPILLRTLPAESTSNSGWFLCAMICSHGTDGEQISIAMPPESELSRLVATRELEHRKHLDEPLEQQGAEFARILVDLKSQE